MKTSEFAEKEIVYVAPQVEVIEVEVEKGFAASPTEDWGEGGNH